MMSSHLQPVQYAIFYYLRTMLHDWADDKAELILKIVASVMGPESLMLTDEMVLPNEGVLVECVFGFAYVCCAWGDGEELGSMGGGFGVVWFKDC